MISSPEECGYDVSDGHTGNVTGGMADKMQPAHIVEDPKRTGSVTDRSIDFIPRSKPKQASLSMLRSVTTQCTCEPNCCSPHWISIRSKGAPDRAYSQGWAGMLEELDSGIARLLDELDALGISDNTYVVFTTDNGGRGTVPGGDPKSPAPNVPLSGCQAFAARRRHSRPLDGSRTRLSKLDRFAGSQWQATTFYLPFMSWLAGKGTLSEELDGGSFVTSVCQSENRFSEATDRWLGFLSAPAGNGGDSEPVNGSCSLR